ncbi:MAG: hypothetical protein ABSC22_11990 [Roseiarcus sp.]|jgi:hypothetical protein
MIWVLATVLLIVGVLTAFVGFAYGMSDNGCDNEKGGRIFVAGLIFGTLGVVLLAARTIDALYRLWSGG